MIRIQYSKEKDITGKYYGFANYLSEKYIYILPCKFIACAHSTTILSIAAGVLYIRIVTTADRPAERATVG